MNFSSKQFIIIEIAMLSLSLPLLSLNAYTSVYIKKVNVLCHYYPHYMYISQFSSVQSLSCVWLLATPWTAACQASLSITNTQRPLKPMSIELVMPSSHLTLYRPLLLLPSIFPSIRVFFFFKWVSSLHQVATILEFQLQHQSFNKHPGLIFRMDWLDLLAVQGTLKSLLQHHSSKASVLQHLDFFTVQFSHTWPLEKP